MHENEGQESQPLYCPTCGEVVPEPLVCGDCAAVICRKCGTPLEKVDELGIGLQGGKFSRIAPLLGGGGARGGGQAKPCAPTTPWPPP